MASSFRAEQANFFFLLRSDEEVGLRSRGISLLLSSFNSDALTDPRSLGYHRRACKPEPGGFFQQHECPLSIATT
jgi:hypothetical protein